MGIDDRRSSQWYLWPKAGFEKFSTPIILQYSTFLSVGINTSVNPSMAIGIFSQWWVRTRYPRWFTKYKCVSASVSPARPPAFAAFVRGEKQKRLY